MVATEVADGVTLLVLLVDVLDELDELDELLVDAVVLCVVETLLVMVLWTLETLLVLVVELDFGAPLAVVMNATQAARRAV